MTNCALCKEANATVPCLGGCGLMYCHTECRDTHANAGHKLGLAGADGNVGPVVICGKCFTGLTVPKNAAGAYYTRFRCRCGQVLEVPGAADWVPGGGGDTPCDVVKRLDDKLKELRDSVGYPPTNDDEAREEAIIMEMERLGAIGSIGSIEWQKRRCANPECRKKGKAKCAACKAVVYCSTKCQRAHWKAHKRKCKEIQLYQKIREGMREEERARQDAAAEAARRVKLGLGVRPAFAQRAHDNAVRWESERHAEAMEASLLRDLNAAPATKKKKKKKKKKKRKTRKKKQTAPQLASPVAAAVAPVVAAVPRARMRLRTTSAPPRINYAPQPPPPRLHPRRGRRERTRSYDDGDPGDMTYREFGEPDERGDTAYEGHWSGGVENPGAAQNEPGRRMSFGGGGNRRRIRRRRTHRKGRRKRRRTRRRKRRRTRKN